MYVQQVNPFNKKLIATSSTCGIMQGPGYREREGALTRLIVMIYTLGEFLSLTDRYSD